MIRRWMTLAVAVLAMAPLNACGTPSSTHLVLTQASDASVKADDHKGHVAPGVFVGITITIANVGTGPARAVTVTDALPSGFHYYELTTIGGDAIRTGIQDPGQQGDPQWGTWTIPAGSAAKESTLVISFKAQGAVQPGDYANVVKISTSSAVTLDQSDPLPIVVDPSPALTVTTAATSAQALSGGTVTYVVSVANIGSAVAHGIAVAVSLPPGFLYLTTSNIEGNGTRLESIDPPGSSLLPLWASWDVPKAANNQPGLLRISFQARILPAVAPGLYTVTTGVTGVQDIPAQTIGGSAPVAVGKGTTIPINMTVAAQSPYAPQNGQVTYVITVENDSTDAAANVTITDTLPQGLTYATTAGITVNGKASGSRLQPAAGASTPQWGPFSIPGGGFSGSTLVITFTAKVAADAPLGAHADLVSGTSSNAQLTGGSDQTPVTITTG
jgi:large repetitive protein